MATGAHPVGYKITPGERIFLVVLYLFFILFTFICVYPFYYLIINSISANDVSARGDVMFYPIGVHLQNYVDVMKIQGLGQAALISVGRTVLGTLCTLLG
ncbi:MAG: carbohydrate ABC transporter permease, partial [Candidatus Spyradocola sp.]